MAAFSKSFALAPESFADCGIVTMSDAVRQTVLYPFLFDNLKDLAALAVTCKTLYEEIRSFKLSFFSLTCTVQLCMEVPLHFVAIHPKHCVEINEDETNLDESWMQRGRNVMDLSPLFRRCVFDVTEILDPKYNGVVDGVDVVNNDEDSDDADLVENNVDACALPKLNFACLEELHESLRDAYGTPEAEDVQNSDVYMNVAILTEAFEYDGMMEDGPDFSGEDRVVCGSPRRATDLDPDVFCITLKPLLFGPTISVKYTQAGNEYSLHAISAVEGMTEDDEEDLAEYISSAPYPIGMTDDMSLETKVDVVTTYLTEHVYLMYADEAENARMYDIYKKKVARVASLFKNAKTAEELLLLMLMLADTVYDKMDDDDEDDDGKQVVFLAVTRMEDDETPCVLV